MKILLIMLLLFSAHASAWDLLLGQHTYHFHEQEKRGRPEFQSEHPLVGISNRKYTVVAMENSYNKFSIAVLRTMQFDLNKYFRAGISTGVANNYEDSPTDLEHDGYIPVVYATVDIHPGNDKYGLILTYAPDEFAGAMLRIKF